MLIFDLRQGKTLGCCCYWTAGVLYDTPKVERVSHDVLSFV